MQEPVLSLSEPILDYVRRRLAEYKGEWPQIANDCEIDHSTVYRIAGGKSTNPELEKIQRLIDWFHARDAMLAKLSREIRASSG